MTDSGYCALDGSFSVTLDWAANVERFSCWLNWLNLGFLGLLASAASFAMWNYACKGLGVVRATIGLYLTPIVGVIFAALFLDERPTPMSTLAGVAAPAVTNAVSGAAPFHTATNAPAYLPSDASFAKQSGYSSVKVSRQRCEAITKSGNRCKRNAVSGGKLCRQHQRIVR